MTTQTNPEVKKPKNLDLEKAERAVRTVILNNKKWIKEMAQK